MQHSRLIICAFSLMLAGAYAGDFENGDFSRGKKYWKITSKNISVTENEQKCLKVVLDEEDVLQFRQHFKVDRKSKKITICYKVKASDDFMPTDTSKPGFGLWFLEDNNTRWINSPQLLQAGKWTDQKSVHDIHDEVREVSLEIFIDPGKGTLYFDDFTVEVE